MIRYELGIMGFFSKKKKLSSFLNTNTSLGRTQAKFLKPTKSELNQLRGGARMRDPPIVKKKTMAQKINKKIDRFNQGVKDFDSIMDNIGNVGSGKKSKLSGPIGSGYGDSPKSLKDPWGL